MPGLGKLTFVLLVACGVLGVSWSACAAAKSKKPLAFGGGMPAPKFRPITWQQDDVTLTLRNVERIEVPGVTSLRVVVAISAPWEQATFRGLRLMDDTGRVLSNDYSIWSTSPTTEAAPEEFDFMLPATSAKILPELSGALDNSGRVTRAYGPYGFEDLRKPTVCDGLALQLFDWNVGGQPIVYNRNISKEWCDMYQRKSGVDGSLLSLRLFVVEPARDLGPSDIEAKVYGSEGEPVALVTDNDMSCEVGQPVTRDMPYMGMHLAPIPAADRKKLGAESGMLVRALDPMGPAAGAGVKAGDVIVGIGETNVACADDISLEIPSGEVVRVSFIRAKQRIAADVTLSCTPMWEGMLSQAPKAAAELKAKSGSNSDLRFALCRLISSEPVPAGFRPERVELAISTPTEATKTLRFEFRDIPIPWR